MPRFVRPSWIELTIDKRGTGFASGPKTKDGGMSAQFFVRDHGSVTLSVRVDCRVVGDHHVLTVFDETGQAICEHVTPLD